MSEVRLTDRALAELERLLAMSRIAFWQRLNGWRLGQSMAVMCVD